MVRKRFEQPQYAKNPIRSTATGRARLTEDDVRQIRYLANEENWPISRITDTFFPSCARETIARVARGETWRHVLDADAQRAMAMRDKPATSAHIQEQLDALEKMRQDVRAVHTANGMLEELTRGKTSEELIRESLEIASGKVPVPQPGRMEGEKRPPVSPLDEE